MGTEWGVALDCAVFWSGICAGWRGQSWQGAEHVADRRCTVQPRARHRPLKDCAGLLILECHFCSRVLVLIFNLVLVLGDLLPGLQCRLDDERRAVTTSPNGSLFLATDLTVIAFGQ